MALNKTVLKLSVKLIETPEELLFLNICWVKVANVVR